MSSAGELEAGFAKLQGEDFEYYMQTYSIVLGRNSKKSLVDVDLASLGGGMNISRQHARIYYDFDRKRFALEVLGKNGCYVEGVLYLKGTTHVKLDTQDLLQIGEKKFYFLLPTKKINKPAPALPAPLPLPPAVAAAPSPAAAAPPKKRGSKAAAGTEDGAGGGSGGGGRKKRRSNGGEAAPALVAPPAAIAAAAAPPSSADEREVVAMIGSVLSDVCGPGEWMPIDQLFSELQFPDRYTENGCSQDKVSAVVSAGDGIAVGSSNGSIDQVDDASEKPWLGLLAFLGKYPEHFIVNIKQIGTITTEYVSLVSLMS